MQFINRINPASIITEHFKTLYDARSGDTSWFEIAALVVLMAAVAIAAALWLPTPSVEFASSLLNFYAIVGGFLISALFIIVSYGDAIWNNRGNLPTAELEQARTLQKEIFSNVSFGVFTAFFGAIVCVFYAIATVQDILKILMSALFVLFAHTLLMVLKRLDKLFRKVA